MAQTTGPIVAAGALTWANTVLLTDDKDKPSSGEMWTQTVRIAVATAVLVAVFNGLEKVAEPIATSIAWTGLVTVLVVRINGKPTPLERFTKLAGG